AQQAKERSLGEAGHRYLRDSHRRAYWYATRGDGKRRRGRTAASENDAGHLTMAARPPSSPFIEKFTRAQPLPNPFVRLGEIGHGTSADAGRRSDDARTSRARLTLAG